MEGFQVQLRVRYHEADQMGIVHHSQYVRYFEIARIEWLRQLGIDYRAMEEGGALLVVAQLEVKYRMPARFDDVLAVTVRLELMTEVRIVLAYEIRKVGDDTLLTNGTTTLACVDRAGRLGTIPPGMRALLPPADPRGGPRFKRPA